VPFPSRSGCSGSWNSRCLDALNLFLSAHAVYHYLIEGFGNYFALENVVWWVYTWIYPWLRLTWSCWNRSIQVGRVLPIIQLKLLINVHQLQVVINVRFWSSYNAKCQSLTWFMISGCYHLPGTDVGVFHFWIPNSSLTPKYSLYAIRVWKRKRES